ncbi:MAG TPA: 3'-5' exonuclease [Methylophilus sp.]|nr:3'-5' exonuclease [Methylophilus sp.]HQQ32395.1 3'-5' exonuclease [Methylophilus sp.]
MTLSFDRPHVIVDLETTGFSAELHRVTEIAIIDLSMDSPTEWSTLINPCVPIPSRITELTGIDDDMVKDAPVFADVADDILGRLDGKVLIAHNASFDHGFLCAEFARSGLSFAAETLCTVNLSRKLYPHHASHSLDAIVERMGIEVTARHRALDDARALMLFLQAVRRDASLLGR